MRVLSVALSAMLLSILCPGGVAAQGVNQRPTIAHEPVKVAVRGQPVTVLARVTDDSGLVKSVTLFYSLSKDAAPFRTVMKSSGSAMYFGTIPANVIESVDRISYYIEAMDNLDAVQETPWYTVTVRDPVAGAASAPPPVVAPPPPAPPQEDEGMSWTTVGLIGVGAAAVVGGAVLVGGGGGGGGGSDNGGDGVQTGDYDGEVTECFTPDGGVPDCEARSMSISIAADGVVASSTIRDGAALQTVLRGDSFSLVADVDDGLGTTGRVTYAGTVVDTRILGSISGDATAPTGSGKYSGTFSAQKRE